MAAADVETAELTDRLGGFLRTYYSDEMGELARKFPKDQRSLTISWSDLLAFDPDIADDLLDQPSTVLEYLEEAVRLYDLPVDIDLADAHVRITDLHDSDVYTVGGYRSDDVNTLVGIKGIVNKATGVLPRVEDAAFECKRCGSIEFVPQSGGFQEPHECKGCERQGPFEINYDESKFHDYRLLRVQEPPDDSTGESTRDIDVILEDELVEEVRTGDRVIVPSILRIEQQGSQNEKERTFEPYAEAIGLDILDTDFTDIDISKEEKERIKKVAHSEDPYGTLIDSFAPGIQGYENVKEGMLLQLFGGVTKQFDDDTEERGIIHTLNIGDPGTGKSSLLRYATEISPRSVLTNGKGSSSAGLTAAAVQDDFGPGGEWSIEGGALVKADRGVAGIDELDKMSESDRDSLHEALEHMEVNPSKAGLSPTLSARTTVVAAANPKQGRFDPYAPIAEQIDLDPALISRFDLIYTFTDEPDEERDREIASHNTTRWRDGIRRTREEYSDDVAVESEPELDKEFVQKYIAYAKREVIPEISPEAQQIVEDEIVELRQSNSDDEDAPVPVTWRKEEAIHRLAEASARVRLSETVEAKDAERAIARVRDSLKDVGIDPETGNFDADILETGTSTSQRQRIKQLEAIIEDLQENTDDWGVDVEDVIEVLIESGRDSSQAEEDIEMLKRKGHAYEPEDGKVALT